jgi:serine/threonine protein kinase
MLVEPYVCIQCGRRSVEPPAAGRCGRCGGEVVGEYSVHKAAQFLFSTEDLESLPPEVERAVKNPNNLFGRYILLRLVGRGGAAEVFRAWHPSLKKVVAIKRIYGQNPDAILRLQREARNAARLDHPSIVQIHDMGVVEIAGTKWYYIAMDFIQGVPLTRAELTPAQKIRVLRDIADALQYAHDHRIVHRDVKPGNILVDDRGRAWLTDFGLARKVDDPRLTVTDVVVGTPVYMPPEQAQGRNQAIDARSDVYSLGATLYEILTGVPPFQGESAYEVINNVVNLAPLPPRSIDDRIDPELEAICLRAMEKDPANRFQTAREFSRELMRFLHGSSRSPRMWLYSLWRDLRRRTSTALVLLGLAVLAGSGTFLIWRALSKPPPLQASPPPPAVVKEDKAGPDEAVQRLAERIERFDRLAYGPAQERGVGLKLLQDTEQALAELPTGPEVLFELGRVRHRLGKLDQAAQDLSHSISLRPSGRAYAARAWVQVDQALRTLLTDPSPAAEFLRKKAVEAARADISRARERSHAGEAEVACLDGFRAALEDRPAEALPLLQRSIDLSSADLELSMRSRSLIADVLFLSGKHLGAMREYEVVSTTRSNDLAALSRFLRAAYAYLESLSPAERPDGDLRAAREAAYRAGQIDPSNLESEFLRGGLFLLVAEAEREAGRRPEADLHSGLAAIARVLEQDPGNGEAHYRASQGYYLLSKTHAQGSKNPRDALEQALYHAKRAVQLDSRLSRARALLAEILAFISRLER